MAPKRLKRLFILLALLTLTTCATHQPLRIPYRQLGTTFVEYTDGTVYKFDDQYKSYVEGTSLRLEHSSGFVRGISFFLWVEWWWVPDTNIPKIQSVADN